MALSDKIGEVLSHWSSKSKVARSPFPGTFNIPCGDHPLMGFDYHPGAAYVPVTINIHGGYGRALDKAEMRHHMADLTRSSFSIENFNYSLCSKRSLTNIIKALEEALEIITAL